MNYKEVRAELKRLRDVEGEVLEVKLNSNIEVLLMEYNRIKEQRTETYKDHTIVNMGEDRAEVIDSSGNIIKIFKWGYQAKEYIDGLEDVTEYRGYKLTDNSSVIVVESPSGNITWAKDADVAMRQVDRLIEIHGEPTKPIEPQPEVVEKGCFGTAYKEGKFSFPVKIVSIEGTRVLAQVLTSPKDMMSFDIKYFKPRGHVLESIYTDCDSYRPRLRRCLDFKKKKPVGFARC